jgi:shikimate dehydrogenase
MTALPGRLVLIGHPVSHSLSPVFQNAALRQAGIPLTYEPLDVAPGKLGSTVGALRAVHASGNVTVPWKEDFAASCDRLTPIAERVGAVNTFWCDGDVLVGDNTDVGGVLEALARAFPARSFHRVALIGAGGSAAAVCAAAERWPGAQVRVWARTQERAAKLAARFAHVSAVASREVALADADLVVNATPLGLQPGDPLPVEPSSIPPKAAVFDLVYQRGETAWVRAARGAGHQAADGLGMLIGQGALAFERWFGQLPDRSTMWAAVSA